MEATALFNNKKGMTLIEIMISLVILMIVALALMQTALLGMNENIKNALRDEAVNIANERINELRNMPVSAILTLGPETSITRTIRKATVTFSLARSAPSSIDAHTVQLTLTLTWSYHNQNFSYDVTTIIKDPNT